MVKAPCGYLQLCRACSGGLRTACRHRCLAAEMGQSCDCHNSSSKALPGTSTPRLSEVVLVLQRGTLDYMPPEMFGSYDEDGEGPGKQAVTQAVDVYSFGLVLWQIVTGGCLDKMQGSLRPPR